jgi:hypothetical protein
VSKGFNREENWQPRSACRWAGEAPRPTVTLDTSNVQCPCCLSHCLCVLRPLLIVSSETLVVKREQESQTQAFCFPCPRQNCPLLKFTLRITGISQITGSTVATLCFFRFMNAKANLFLCDKGCIISNPGGFTGEVEGGHGARQAHLERQNQKGHPGQADEPGLECAQQSPGHALAGCKRPVAPAACSLLR